MDPHEKNRDRGEGARRTRGEKDEGGRRKAVSPLECIQGSLQGPEAWLASALFWL